MKSSSVGKRLFTCLALLLTHAAAAPAQAPRITAPPARPVEWREFTSAEGGFKVRFPAPPQFRKVPFGSGPFAADQHLHVAQLGDAAIFGVAYIDLPPGGNKNPEMSYEGAVIQVTRSIIAEGGRVLSSGKVARGTCEGREVTGITRDAAGSQSTFKHGQVFRSGRRAYVVLFMAPGNGEDPAARELNRTFMESFAVADGCRGTIAPLGSAPLAPKTTTTVEGTPDAATGWREIASPERGFSVLMPGRVQLDTAQTRPEPMSIFRHTYVHTSDSSVYLAEVEGDYPAGFYSGPVGMETMLDLALLSARRNLEPFGITMTHLRDLKTGPHTAREYALVSEKLGGSVGRAQLYITPQRIYSFVAVDRDAAARERNLGRFFSSIKIGQREGP